MSKEYEEMNVEKWVNLEDVAVGKRYKFKISEVDEWVRTGKITE